MDVSIIIVNYKTPDLVIDCINSVRQLTEGISYEIIVVDNASKDNSLEELRKEFGETIKLIESDTNLGFGRANNLGFENAVGDYVFLLNSDTVLVNNAIKILYDYLKNNNNIGIVGGNLYSVDMKENSSFSLSFDDVNSLKKKARWTSIITEIIFRLYRQRFYSDEQKRRYTYKNTFNHTDRPMEVGYIFGADMMLSRKLYNKMGGFDLDFFMYAEEEELSWRIHQAGYKIISVPAAKIIHLDGGTFKRYDTFNARQYEMRMTGAMTYYKKRFGPQGVQYFYHYRMLRLERQHKLAKLMHRPMLQDVSQKQMNSLTERYEKIKQQIL
ncbi:MAG: glycosyltransferase family 2 protein [Oscillospiraceae bacterium]|nr:glycosyltransferase family 2 protein [Oscillospiraceae bacterium]